MSKLEINANAPVDLLSKAKEIACKHKELQPKASRLQVQVSNLEQELNALIQQRQREIVEEYLNRAGSGSKI